MVHKKDFNHLRGQGAAMCRADKIRDQGRVKEGHKDYHGAINLYVEAKKYRILNGTMETMEGARLLMDIGRIKDDGMKDWDGALVAYEEARRITTLCPQYGHAGGLDSPEHAELLRRLGRMRGRKGDHHSALVEHEEAHRQLQRTQSLGSVGGARVLRHLGLSKTNQGDYAGAVASYEEARKIRSDLNILHSRCGAQLMGSIGAAKHKLGQTSDALESYKEAHMIRSSTGSLGTLHGAQLLGNMATLQRLDGDTRGAMSSFAQACVLHNQMGNAHRASQALEETQKLNHHHLTWTAPRSGASTATVPATKKLPAAATDASAEAT